MGKPGRKEKIRRFLADGVSFLLGSMAFGVAVSVFAAPAEIAPGGVTGLSVLIQYLFHFPVGLTSFCINLPLLILAFYRFSRRFFIRTLLGLALSSVMIDLFALVPPFQGDRLLSSICAGVFTGLGVGLIYNRGGSTGGAEIVAMVLRRRFPFFSAGNMLLAVDGAVILLSFFVYRDLGSLLYATVTVFLSAQVMDRVIYGGRTGCVALAVTKQEQAVTNAVMSRLNRGVTSLPAVGGYSGEHRRLLVCAAGQTEGVRLRQVILDADPEAFIIFTAASEILGQGFEKMKNEE